MPSKQIPHIVAPLPGQRSVSAAQTLGEVEASSISSVSKGGKPLFWERAEGVWVEDLDGNSFLDCTSSFGVASLGYCHPYVQEAVVKQCTELMHSMIGIFPHLPYIKALRAIAASVGRHSRTEVLLTNSGSEAVEVALKLSLSYTGRPGVIAFHGGFHGQSLGALSVTSHNELRTPFLSILAHNTTWVPFPNPYRPSLLASSSSIADACLATIENVLRADRVGGEPIGAILIEPMQNASGYIVPPEGFLRQLRQLCKQYDVLLILDEIFTGFGRSGQWLASDRESVTADIVCVGKSMTGAIPSGACVADHSIMTTMSTDGIVPLHGSTFVGNPIACTAITSTIEVLNKENLIIRANAIGNRLRSRIRELCGDLPCIGEVRGLGAAIAVEFVKGPQSKERDPSTTWAVMDNLLNHGVITLVTGLPYGNVLALCPPFVISDDQCDFVADMLKKSIETVKPG